MNHIYLSLNLLRRDWRAGEWRVLLIALVLAVGSITTVGLFTDRVGLALQQEATSLLGADLRISSTRSLSPNYRAAALQRELQVIETASFPSMVAGKQHNVLAEILVVEDGYPLRGKIEINDGITHIAQGIPSSGTLWVDTRLLQRLGVQVGDMVDLGALHLRVAAEVVRDVDQSIRFTSFAPRVILNVTDLPASGLVQEGSRIHYNLLVAGDAMQVANLRVWLQEADRMNLGEKLEDVRDARPEIRTALERAEHFLGLAALTAVVLAGVALALAARHFILRHLNACAMMRCLGASQAQILRIFLYQFLLLGLFGVLLGVLIGYFAQAALVQSLVSMREAHLPPPSWTPIWQAGISGMALLLGFTFLPLWQLKSVSPLRVIRRELGVPALKVWIMFVGGVVVLCGLFLWQAGSLKLGLTVLGGLLAGLLIFVCLAWMVVRVLARLGNHALSNLARHGRSNAVQIVALSLGGMALLLLTFVRIELLDSWHSRLPADVPNRFIINIQPNQRAAVQDFFTQQNLALPEMFPMVKGRLVAINQRGVSADDYAEKYARELMERETNLSWMTHQPKNNELVAGQWWHDEPASTQGQLSVEEGMATALGIHLGDVLTYDVAGSQFSAKVVSLRKLQWDSMQVNFYVISAPKVLEDFPASYITSFHLPQSKSQSINELIKQIPSLLVIDTEAIITQVRFIIDQIAQAMSAVFIFTLLSGVVVLYAALLSTQDERIYQTAILRTLGAKSRYVRQLHLTEFATLGALSGLFSAAGAVLLGWILARYVLEIPYHFSAIIWPIGICGGIITVSLAGWLATQGATRMSPLVILREQ